MPLQRLTIDSDYSPRLINALSLPYNRQPPRGILTAPTRSMEPPSPMPALINSPLLCSAYKAHPSLPNTVGEEFQRRLEIRGSYNDTPDLSFKTRKFAGFSASEAVTMGRGTAPTLSNRYRQAIIESPNTPPEFTLPAQPISQSIDQLTTLNPEDHVPSSIFQHLATKNPEDPSTFSSFQYPEAQSTSSQLPTNSESNAPANKWRQTVASSCVGVALVDVATGYACTTVFQGALNVWQFVYSNRKNIQQTCMTCTQAVQSTYNAAKRRMVSIYIPRLPVGMRRRYAPQPTPQDLFRQRRLLRHSRAPAELPTQSWQSISPVVSILVPEGMPGVEYSGLSDVGKFPDKQDAADPDAFVLRRPSAALTSGAPYMTGGLFHEKKQPPNPMHEEPTSENPSDTVSLEEMGANPAAMDGIRGICLGIFGGYRGGISGGIQRG